MVEVAREGLTTAKWSVGKRVVCGRAGYECEAVTDLERFLTWIVYAAALEARKQRKHARLVSTYHWKQDVSRTAAQLGTLGLVL